MQNLKSIVSFNKKIIEPDDAKISIFDRGFLYGDSVYEVTLIHNGKSIFLEEHLNRLEKSANSLYMPLQVTREEIKEEIAKIQKILNDKRLYIRIIVTRGEGEIGLDPNLATNQNLVILGKEILDYPKEWYEHGVKVIIANTLRNPRKSIDPNIKSGNYLNNVLAMIAAKKQGAFDAIMLNQQGNVAEGTTNNIWVVKNKLVSTPPLNAGLLEGITRAKILAFKSENFTVKERDFAPQELFDADEVFFTSSTKEVVPIVQINDKNISLGTPGNITKEIHKIYKNLAYFKLVT